MDSLKSSAHPLAPDKIVTFRIAGRTFGVDVGCVREIKGWQSATPLPATAAHVLGVINLRGQIVPVYDLRLLLALDAAETATAKVVLVLAASGGTYGVVADAVSDILDVRPEEVRLSPTFDGGDGDLVSHLVVKAETVIALMNTGAVLRH